MSTTYLTSNFGSGTDDGVGQKSTHSVWIKRTDPSGDIRSTIISGVNGSAGYMKVRFGDNDRLQIYGAHGNSNYCNVETKAEFRDVSGWYHVVLQIDTSNSTASERVKWYVNGELQELNTATYPSQGEPNYLVISNDLEIGRNANGTNEHFDGTMSHFHGIYGTIYAPTAFGETDATTGEWKIKTSPSVTYGTYGFFILKDGNTVTDSSPNSNTFTVSGGTLTKTEDNPSNVFATWNSVAANLDTTLTNGNTKVAHGSQLERRPVISALGMSSGKYYAEFKALSGSGGNLEVGIVNRSDPTTQGRYMGQSLKDAGWISYKFDGVVTFDGTDTSGLTSTSANDILGVAVDIDNTRVYFYKNGTLINSGGTSFANMQGGDGDYFFCNGDRSGSSTYSLEANFGNGYFGSTQISSAGTNASGNGIFEYDVPSGGYTALSTKGLNT